LLALETAKLPSFFIVAFSVGEGEGRGWLGRGMGWPVKFG